MGLFERLRGGDDPRVVFIGIDGVPYGLIADHPETFRNLHAIADEGVGTAIESIVPPESSACWPALTTGTNPGKTGVYGFQDRRRDSYETYIPMGSDVRSERIWDIVTDHGREASVFNVPVTFPPSTRIQRQVSGFLSPSVDDAASSDEIRRTLRAGGYAIDVDAKLGHDPDKRAFVRNAHETLDARHEAFLHYIDEDDWDLFVGVYMTTDRVNHFLFGDYANGGEYAEEFLAFYRTLDAAIGEIRDRLDDDTTLVVASDHGFTELTYEVHCNQWLADNGWLSYIDTDTAADADFEADREKSEPGALADIHDDARAYSLIPGRFYLNLEGREPRGSVPRADYDAVREELIAALEGLVGPDGRRVARRVVPGEDAFQGGATDIAPDLVVIPADGYDLKSGFSTTSDVFSTGARNGMHTYENASLFATSGELDVADGADLLDIAPTVLDMMDIDTACPRMDGSSLIR